VDARKAPLDREAALALVRGAKTLLVARGKKLVRHEIKAASPSDDEIAALIVGRSGNLRAPTVRFGEDLFCVGFSEEALTQGVEA
jgi:hypothetical protein